MKATLEFNLPEDQSQFDIAVSASKMYAALWDIEQFLRNKLEYMGDDLSQAELSQLEEIQNEFYKILDYYSFNIDEPSGL